MKRHLSAAELFEVDDCHRVGGHEKVVEREIAVLPTYGNRADTVAECLAPFSDAPEHLVVESGTAPSARRSLSFQLRRHVHRPRPRRHRARRLVQAVHHRDGAAEERLPRCRRLEVVRKTKPWDAPEALLNVDVPAVLKLRAAERNGNAAPRHPGLQPRQDLIGPRQPQLVTELDDARRPRAVAIEDEILRSGRADAGDARPRSLQQTRHEVVDERDDVLHHDFLPTTTTAPSAGSYPKHRAASRRNATPEPRARRKRSAYCDAAQSNW